MLSNVFDTVAARRHKGREVDNLLIVTAPHERMVLGCLMLFVLAAAVWAALGSVDRVVSFDCTPHRPASDQPWRATLWVAPTIAQSIDPGMAAQFEMAASDGATLKLQGKVVPTAKAALSQGFAARLAWPVGDARRIDIDITGTGADAALPVTASGRCRVSISLGRQSIADLLGFKPL